MYMIVQLRLESLRDLRAYWSSFSFADPEKSYFKSCALPDSSWCTLLAVVRRCFNVYGRCLTPTHPSYYVDRLSDRNLLTWHLVLLC